LQLDAGLLIKNFLENTDHRTTRLEALDHAGSGRLPSRLPNLRIGMTIQPRIRRTQDYGCVVAGIDITKCARRRIVFAKEKVTKRLLVEDRK